MAAPRRTHLEIMARQGDPAAIAELASVPPLPDLVAYLWGWFAELHATRQGGFGLARLTRQEIRLWEEDEGHRLEPWERQTLMALDAQWLRHQGKDPPPEDDAEEGG